MKQKDMQEVGEKMVKRKGQARPQQQPQVNPGDNAKYIRHSLRLVKLPKISMQDAEAVKERVYTYFKICEEEDMKPSVIGLAVALDIDRDYLWKLRVGERKGNPEVVDTLKKAVKLLDLQMVDYMQNGKINPVSGIFLMKNNFGYADKQEVVVTPSSPMGDITDTKELEDKYRDSVPIETEGTEIENFAESAESENP